MFTASASYDSSGITGVELDESQALSTLNKTAGTYNFVANIIEGNADDRITYEYSSDTLTDVTIDTSVYFDNADTGSYSFKFKWDSITYEDSNGNLAENDITYSDDDENTSTGSMYYVDSDGNAVVGLISYEDEDGNISGQWYTTDDEDDYTVEVDLAEYGITVEGTPDNGDLIEVTVDELVDDSFYWTLSGSTVDLDDYGISYTGTPADNDIITVVVTSLLADGDTITVTVEDPEDEEVSQVYMLQTQGVFTVTIANGSSYTVSDQLTCSISDLSDGVYNVYVDPVNGEITVLDNNITAGIIMPSSAGDDDYLLNISQIPYDLQSKSESGLTAVRAGILTISDLGKFLTLFRYNTNNLHGITNTVNQIGDPIVSLNSVLADNEIWLEGAEISCTSYPALYEVYGDTYGEASTDGYFVLPDFRERAIWGSDSFGYIDAGLPDLYGYIGMPSSTSDGSLFYGTRSGDYYDRSGSGGKSQYGTMYFEASNYDSIYGSSDTVQPPAIRVRVKTRFI